MVDGHWLGRVRRKSIVILGERAYVLAQWPSRPHFVRYGDEVRDEDAYFGEIDDRKPGSKVMPLIQQLIKKQAHHWDSHLVSSLGQAAGNHRGQAEDEAPVEGEGLRSGGCAQ